MSANFLGPKPVRSVAAFLWMPQFRLSFQHMSHLAPVFVRTLAGVFAGAGLIAPNHPALLYGSPEVDGSRASFGALMGDVWFALRTQKTSITQWGMFIAVAFLLALAMMACVTTIATLAFGVGATAQAQLFSHPLGDSSVKNHVPAPPYDLAVPAPGTPQGDYGIMMLDKVVRAGAYGKGLPIQNALRDLMLTYNSAVLVVASVILFWMILSVVVDTAKTGQIGGGRHNMVWGPIRIVFALALLIPMGSAGFSSGQYMVMKVAEWGSNLGTNAWEHYVKGTLSDSNVIANQSATPATEFLRSYEKMWLCVVSYNAMMEKTGSSERMAKRKLADKAYDGKNQYQWVAPDGRSCGALTYKNSENTYQAMMDFTGTKKDSITDMLDSMLEEMKENMRQAYVRALLGEKEEPGLGLGLEKELQKAACRFASTTVFFNKDPDLGILQKQPECAGAVLAPLLTPQTLGYNDLIAINEAFGKAVGPVLQAELNKARVRLQDSKMLDMMTQRGWAGMGAWYHRISQINGVAASLIDAPFSVAGNSLPDSTDTESTSEDSAAHQVPKDASKVLKAFDDWWLGYATSGSGSSTAQRDKATGALAPTAMNPEDLDKSSGLWDTLKGLVKGARSVISGTWLTNLIVEKMGFNTGYGAEVLIKMVGGNDVYPLAQLAAIGHMILGLGMGIQVGLLVVQVLVQGATIGALAGLGIWDMIGSLGTILMIAGLMLKIYVPLIPFMRVIFAVLTWIISVFEAVVMVPIAALAHLSLDGDGLAGGAKNVWILWLNILLRPILTVIGFVGALLVFNAFVSFFNDNFTKSLVHGMPADGLTYVITLVAYMVIYVFIIYTAANTVFKLLDIIPSAMMRWMGGSPDHSFDNNSDSDAMLAASNFMRGNHIRVRGKEGGGKDGGGSKDSAGVKPAPKGDG